MARFGLAVWSHHIKDFGGRDEIERHAQRLADAGYDTLIPCVKNPPGSVDFLTDLADVNPAYPGWDPLKILIESCQAKGVKVHPWFCVFTEGEQSKLLREQPGLRASIEGNVSRTWACACRDDVQDYAFSLYRDLALRYRPDGLHLDYIRTGGPCRCEFCTEQMKGKGVDITAVDFKDPASELWTEWRASRITGFVKRLHQFTSDRRMELSAAVFAGYPDSIRGQGQDWLQWAELGIVDYIFPMNYTNSLRVARTRTISHVALIGGRTPVWEGLGKASSASQLSTEALRDQVKGVIAAGAGGVVLFHYGAVTSEDERAIRLLREGGARTSRPRSKR